MSHLSSLFIIEATLLIQIGCHRSVPGGDSTESGAHHDAAQDDTAEPHPCNHGGIEDTEEPDVARASLRARALPPDSPVFRYAPTVFLHPEEKYLPMSADTFLSSSSLNWNRDQACPDHRLVGVGKIKPAKLGAGSYKHQMGRALMLACMEYGRQFRSSEFTRPGYGVSGGEGFFLNLLNTRRSGEGTRAPTYYEYVPGAFITYWFLYGFNVPPGPESIMADFAHEGDWEGISIKLDSTDRAVEVAFFAHGREPMKVAWERVSKSYGSHLDVYSAKGSHASYPRAGAYAVSAEGEIPLVGASIVVHDQAARGGPDRQDRHWRTWENLRDARGEPWYGFGGGWGEMCGGAACWDSGPTGPSLYKSTPYAQVPGPVGKPCPNPTRPRCCGAVDKNGKCDGPCVGLTQHCP